MGKKSVAWLNINYVLAPRPSFSAKAGATEGVTLYVTDNPSKTLCLEILSKAAIAVQNADASILFNVDGGKIIEDPDFPPKAAVGAAPIFPALASNAAVASPSAGNQTPSGTGRSNTTRKTPRAKKAAQRKAVPKLRNIKAKGR